MNGNPTNLFYLISICYAFALCSVYIHLGNTKIGYHVDEVFSYMSSNSEKNYKEISALCDNSWYPSEYFHDALSVAEGCQFHYEIPVRNQETDVTLLFIISFCIPYVFFGAVFHVVWDNA